ncbi:MAG: hypothetical protein KGK08_06880 [Acidobacteriota bacterium]|nr:hypothetical protein [Acidobacteriota bacterium]
MSTQPIASQPRTETAPRRVWCNFHAALGALVATIAFLFCGRNISDPDIWWHLRNAQLTLQQHHFIRSDSYAWTTHGMPWINSEWLAEMAYYAIYRVAGYRGIFGLFFVLAEAAMLGVLVIATQVSGKVKSAFLISPLAVLMSVVNFGPRTILFGWLCMAAVMLILWRFTLRGSAPLYLIPVIFLLWVNLHGSWLVGLVVCGIFVAGRLVQGSWGSIDAQRWTPAQLRQLTLTAVSTLAVLFINPYGYRLVFYPFDLAYRQKLNIAHIEEWASVNFHEPRGKIVYLLLMLVILLAMLGRKRWILTEVLLVLFAFYTSLTYIRFLFLGALLLGPVLARHLDFLPPYKREIDKPWVNAVFVAAAAAIIFFRFPTTAGIVQDMKEKYPTAALHYVQTHGGGKVMNAYAWGGYMIWTTPDLPTFIDSRTDIFEYKGVLKDYLDITGLKDTLAVIDRYQPRFLLFQPTDPLVYMLRNTTRWHVVYEDKVSCLLERSTP